MAKKDFDFEYCTPSGKIKGMVGVYRQQNTGRRNRCGIETDGEKYLRVYNDDVDGGSDFTFPESVVKEFFRKVKNDILHVK